MSTIHRSGVTNTLINTRTKCKTIGEIWVQSLQKSSSPGGPAGARGSSACVSSERLDMFLQWKCLSPRAVPRVPSQAESSRAQALPVNKAPLRGFQSLSPDSTNRCSCCLLLCSCLFQFLLSDHWMSHHCHDPLTDARCWIPLRPLIIPTSTIWWELNVVRIYLGRFVTNTGKNHNSLRSNLRP